MSAAIALQCFSTVALAANQQQQQHQREKSGKRRPEAAKTRRRQSNKGFRSEGRPEPLWRCVEGCGACCKLAKGPSFASPEEIFNDPADIELYRSLIGPDGWCIHYEKSTRKCSIYPDRPYFCRVEPDVFLSLYGIGKKKFNREACSSCRDTIKAIYGSHSKELNNFNQNLKSSTSTLDHSTSPSYSRDKLLSLEIRTRVSV